MRRGRPKALSAEEKEELEVQQQQAKEEEAQQKAALDALNGASWQFEQDKVRAGGKLYRCDIGFDENLGRDTYSVAGRTFIKDRGIFINMHEFNPNSQRRNPSIDEQGEGGINAISPRGIA